MQVKCWEREHDRLRDDFRSLSEYAIWTMSGKFGERRYKTVHLEHWRRQASEETAVDIGTILRAH